MATPTDIQSMDAMLQQPTTTTNIAHNISLSYGPWRMEVAEPSMIFFFAERLLQRGTPFLPFHPTTTEEAAQSPPQTLPAVRLPVEMVHRILHGERIDGDGLMRHKLHHLADGVLEGKQHAELRLEGRPALEVATKSFGSIVATNQRQWSSLVEILAKERDEERAAKQPTGEVDETDIASAPLLVQAELIMLWYDEELLHRLHYQQLTGLNSLAEQERLQHDRASCKPGGCGLLSATLFVVDRDSEPRGEVQIPIGDPPLSRQELLELVRAATGVRRHRQLRLAYRILPPDALCSARVDEVCGQSLLRHDSLAASSIYSMTSLHQAKTSADGRVSGSPARPVSRRAVSPTGLHRAPLRPIESQRDMEHLIRSILLHGYRSVRIVVAEAVATSSTARLSPSASMDRPPLHASIGRISSSNVHHNDQQEEAELVPPSPSAVAPEEDEVEHDVVEHATTPKHIAADVAAGAAVVAEMPSTTSADAVVPPSPTAAAVAKQPAQKMVVVRYELNPTELHVSGNVSDVVLLHLSEAIFMRCCGGAEQLASMNGQATAMSHVLLTRPRFVREDGPHGAAPSHILRLHSYNFNQEQEHQLEMCVTEVMRSLEGYQHITEEQAKAVYDL